MEIACCSTTATSPIASSFLRRSKPSSLAFHTSLSFAARRAPPAPMVSVSRQRRTRSAGLECKCVFGLGVPEMVVIAGVAALVFGPKKLPDIGRSIGKTVKGFQQAAKEFETELKNTPPESETPPPENPQAVNGGEPKKELETSSTKESV